MRTLPHLAALALALGALACAGAPAAAQEGSARTDGFPATAPDGAARTDRSTSADLGDHDPRGTACPDAGSSAQVVAGHARPAGAVAEGAAVVVALDAAPPSQAAAPPLACVTLSTAQVPGIPEGRVDAGLEAARSGNLGALVVAGAGALSVVGSAVVAQRRTAAQQ